jgi:hypothetical protein
MVNQMDAKAAWLAGRRGSRCGGLHEHGKRVGREWADWLLRGAIDVWEVVSIGCNKTTHDGLCTCRLSSCVVAQREESGTSSLVVSVFHPGVLATKVGYFGVKSTKVYQVQMGTKPAKSR